MGKRFQGPTEAEAAILACEALDIPRGDLNYRVIERISDEDERRVIIEVTDGTTHASRSPIEIEEQPEDSQTRFFDPQGQLRTSSRRQNTPRPFTPKMQPNRATQPHRDAAPHTKNRSQPQRNNSEPRRFEAKPQRPAKPRYEDFRDAYPQDYEKFKAMTSASADTPIEPRAAIEESRLSPTARKAFEITQQLLQLAGLSSHIQVSMDNEEEVWVDVHGDDDGLIIGRKGETLHNLQLLVNRLVNNGLEGAAEKVVLDCQNYKYRRVEALRILASTLGERVRTDQRALMVNHLGPQERRVFHLALDGQNGLKTRSEGEGSRRRMLILPLPNESKQPL